MHRPISAAFSLVHASEDDIPSLIRVHMAGFGYDNSVRLMFKDKDEWEAKLRDMLKTQLSSPNYAVIKAISKDNGNVLGWQTCHFFGKDDLLESIGAFTGIEESADETNDGKDRTLRSVLDKEYLRVLKEWMTNRKWILFQTLVVDPAAQGHGVGTALARWVTDRADEDGVYCWLISTPAAHGIYLKGGYRDVGSFEVDLGEFAFGGKEGGWGWGMYKVRHMLRLPED